MKSLPYILAILIAVVLIISFTSCTSSKNIQQTKTESDSTVIKVLKDSIRLYKDAVTLYESIINNTENAIVTFHDPVATKDSAIKYTHLRNGYNWLPGKVTVSKDGIITAEGNIKSFAISKSKYEAVIFSQQETIDSFALELDKTKSELSKKETVKVVEKKTTVIPWWAYIIGLPFLLLWLREKFYKKKPA